MMDKREQRVAEAVSALVKSVQELQRVVGASTEQEQPQSCTPDRTGEWWLQQPTGLVAKVTKSDKARGEHELEVWFSEGSRLRTSSMRDAISEIAFREPGSWIQVPPMPTWLDDPAAELTGRVWRPSCGEKYVCVDKHGESTGICTDYYSGDAGGGLYNGLRWEWRVRATAAPAALEPCEPSQRGRVEWSLGTLYAGDKQQAWQLTWVSGPRKDVVVCTMLPSWPARERDREFIAQAYNEHEDAPWGRQEKV